MAFRALGLVGLFFVASCGSGSVAEQPVAQPTVEAPAPDFAAIERRTGGRLGMALVDSHGRLLLTHRAGERFAMCSTFKLPLAAMILDGAGEGRWRLDERLPASRADLLSHSPVLERYVAAGEISVEDAAEAIVTQSDNGAANLLLRRFGGPEALTAWLRANGDPATRLDRFELELNENAAGDPRDTTTPEEMARTSARLVHGEVLDPAGRERLRAWTTATSTGARRIRAGLPANWPAGDKTGSCGTAWNDVAWFEAPNGRSFALAVYLDRPTVSAAEAEAAIAEVARLIAQRVRSGG